MAIWVLLVTGTILSIDRLTSGHSTSTYGIVFLFKLSFAIWMFYLVWFRNRSGNRKVIDTLKLARKNSPGKRNTLDALCSRFFVDNTERNLHGALMDAELLAQVYLKMTQGQTDIAGLNEAEKKPSPESMNILSNRTQRIIEASEEDMHKHTNYFK